MKQSLTGLRIAVLALGVIVASCSKKGPDNNGTGGGDGNTGTEQSALRVTSFPVKNSATNSPWMYQAALSEPGKVEWTIVEGPEGSFISSAGLVTWTPTGSQQGTQSFVLKGRLGEQAVEQRFQVEVTHFEVAAGTSVDPTNPNGTSLSVDAPLSPVRGSGIMVSPGALPGSTPIDLTISAVSNSPVPLSAQLQGLSATDLKAVEFGPAGLTFTKPVTIYLPIPTGFQQMASLDIQTYNFATGQWERVPVLSIDKDNGVAAAEVSHFSLYTVTPSSPTLSFSFAAGPCADTTYVQAALQMGFATIPASVINGYAGTGTTLADALAGLGEGESIQVLTQLSEVSTAQNAWTLASATRRGSSLSVSVVSSDHPSPYLAIPAELAASEVEAWLNGSRFHSLLHGVSLAQASVHGSASLYFLGQGADPLVRPSTLGNALGQEETGTPGGAAYAEADSDCDGAPNAYDATPEGDLPPSLAVMPQSPVGLIVGQPLSVMVSSDGTLEWQSSNAGLIVTPTADGATFTASTSGAFRVQVLATKGSGTRSFAWEVFAQEQPAANTAPTVLIAAAPSLAVREGEAVTLTAVARDPEQSPNLLSYRWSVGAGATLSSTSGGVVSFRADAAGDYRITCTASDGLDDSNEASVTVSVLAAAVNRPPEPPVVSPMSALLQHGAGEQVTITLTATARDPDGDALTYQFDFEPGYPEGAAFAQSGNRATFSAYNDGSYLIWVRATDDKGLAGAPTPVRLNVAPTLPPAPVDADGDGHPSTVDCNDGDRSVFPGAREVCGDGIDQDCSGADLGASACDRDGDRYTPDQGDCDDQNPAKNPGLKERCDSIDNDCDGQVDEDFAAGQACLVGRGACQRQGVVSCSSSLLATACTATPGMPTAESCNGIDDDCNGSVDDVATASSGTDINNCGGCGITCSAGANMVPQCMSGGCSATCSPGYRDADRNLATGCECQINTATGGKEICNGIDDDCNGFIDENVTQAFYSGPSSTQGIGECIGGFRVCVAGQFVEKAPERTPRAEQCDGRDNNCDGKVDETFPLLQDSANCGACGRACAPGQGCFNGQCLMPPVDGGTAVNCGPDRQLCGSICVDTRFNSQNCGACGHDCGSGSFCEAGQCKVGDPFQGTPCPTPQLLCQGTSAASSYCASIGSDPLNCGACGFSCQTGQACISGQCVPAGTLSACPQDALSCSNQNGNYCAWAFIDPLNCGACGQKCPTGNACVSGQCRPDTKFDGGTACGPFNQCGPMCTDFSRDPWNCGSCGNVCGADGMCFSGTCQAKPDGGFIDCGPGKASCTDAAGATYCTDPMFDPRNCGACGQGCGSTEACFDGVCQPKPDGGTGGCGSASLTCSDAKGGSYCTDPRFDPRNCGACGTTCAADQGCFNGLCQAKPDGGTFTCGTDTVTCTDPRGGSYCTDPRYDMMNCGGCGIVCGVNQGCFNGMCQSKPDGGTSTCGPDSITCTDARGGSYCTDPRYDPMNCGGCGIACGPDQGCFERTCQPRPDGGTTTCGPNSMTCTDAKGGSYCTDPRYDPMNCGGCGIACGPDQGCFERTCQPRPDGGTVSCGPNQLACTTAAGGAYCTDPRYDPMNCGGCGIACGPDQGCFDRICQPRSDGGMATCGPESITCTDTKGGTFCADPRYDPMNCGGCGIMCGPDQGCFERTCQPRPDGGTVSCGPNQLACTTASGGSYCTDPMNDPRNCGGCGHDCGPDSACNSGVCQPRGDGGTFTCGPNQMMCTTPVGTNFCTDPQNDPMNCGGCGKQCDGDSVCSSGFCQPKYLPDGGLNCGTGGTTCEAAAGPYCADLGRDPNNCGGCGITCGFAMACLDHACVPESVDGGACPTGATRLCYFGPPATLNVGVCHGGAQSCGPAGAWEACNGQRLPGGEMCGNGQDEDCDGVVDNGCPVTLAPPMLLMLPSSNFTFVPQGGTPPFSWSLTANSSGGSISASGAYVSGASAGNDVVRVSSADGSSSEATVSVMIDPTVSLSPPGGTFRALNLKVFVRTVAGATITGLLDGNPITVPTLNPDGTGILPVPLNTEGPHSLTVTASAASLTGSATADYVLDLTPPPSPAITSPAPGESLAGPTVVVNGTSAPETLVELAEPDLPMLGSQTVGVSGTFSITTPELVTGQHVFMARASDIAGNHSLPTAPIEVMITNGLAAPLSVRPMHGMVRVGGAIRFLATGGQPTYSWVPVSLVSGGTISPSGHYTAGTTVGTDVIRLIDSLGTPLDVMIDVTP